MVRWVTRIRAQFPRAVSVIVGSDAAAVSKYVDAMFRLAARSVLSRVSATVDDAAGLFMERAALPQHAFPPLRIRMERATDKYGSLSEAELFPVPPIPEPTRSWSTRSKIKGAIELVWPSAHQPVHVDKDSSFPSEASLVATRLFMGDPTRPRPVAVLVHGWGWGDFQLEERNFRTSWLLEQGLDVCLFALPGHGLRNNARALVPAFPGPDPFRNIEGFRQAISDLRATIRYLRANGHGTVGVVGTSLGGYAASLLGTVPFSAEEGALDFLTLLIPLGSIPTFLRQRGWQGEALRRARLTLEAAYKPISPLCRAPTIPGERTLVISGKIDRVTPVSHSSRLASHFDCEHTRFEGGHVLQTGRAASLRRFRAQLERVGAAAPASAR